MLENAVRIERLSEKLYRTFARALADYDGLRAAFEQLAGDEAEHVECLRMLVDACRKDPPEDADLPLSAERLELMVAELSIAIELVRGSSEPGMIVRMVRWALEMERELGAIHADKLVADVRPELREMLAMLAEGDATHVVRLEQIARHLT
jgi:rubrerythrin